MNGGYKMVSLKGVNFTIGEAQTIAGIHESIENNYHKALMLTDIVIDGIERADRFMTFGATSSGYTGYLAISYDINYLITIKSDDTVKITIE